MRNGVIKVLTVAGGHVLVERPVVTAVTGALAVYIEVMLAMSKHNR